MEVREIIHGSSEYEAEVSLRDLVLRKPLGLCFSLADLENESSNWHFGLFEGGEILATLQFGKLSDSELKMMQVAVNPLRQGQGLGKLIVAWSEAWAKSRDYRRITLHARESAIAFYQTQGYIVSSEEFLEVGIPHREMFKEI